LNEINGDGDEDMLYSYNGRQIGTRMRSIEWCQYQWPWVTCDQDFKVTSIFDQYVALTVQDRHISTLDNSQELITHALINGVISNDFE